MHDPDLRKLLIIGAGGSGREVAWLAKDVYGLNVEFTFAVEPKWRHDVSIDGIPVILFDRTLRTNSTHYVVAIGDSAERRRIASTCDALGLRAATLVHPSVQHSSRVEFGPGSIVCAGAIVTTNVRIGRHVHVNIGCTISHDVVVGDFATLSPGVHLAGHVRVEDGVFLGTGANVINGSATKPLILGSGATIAAGACVIHPVPPGVMVAGVPATTKR